MAGRGSEEPEGKGVTEEALLLMGEGWLSAIGTVRSEKSIPGPCSATAEVFLCFGRD